MEVVKRKQVRHKDILDYWDGKVSELDLNVDFADGLEYCWGCGYKSTLQGAHIIPHCLGGESKASNMVLLCRRCNTINPHCPSEEDFWRWMKSQSQKNIGGLYDTSRIFDIFQEYKKLYEKDIILELTEIFSDSPLDFRSELENFIKENSSRYYINNIATKATFYREFVLKMREKVNKK